jgi:hypothetical protein
MACSLGECHEKKSRKGNNKGRTRSRCMNRPGKIKTNCMHALRLTDSVASPPSLPVKASPCLASDLAGLRMRSINHSSEKWVS